MLEEIHMNFREKVKALLETEEAGYRRREIKTGEEGGVKDEMTGKKVKISGPHDPEKSEERVAAGKQRVPKSMMQAVLDKLRALEEESQNEGKDHSGIRRPVYVRPDPTIADLVRMGQGSKEEHPRTFPKKKTRKRVSLMTRLGLGNQGVEDEEKSKTNENSNHPFYQKVKELSRGNKKNNSLLERKSNIIRLVIARLKPNEEKSKMDEVKKDDEGWNKARKKRLKIRQERDAQRRRNAEKARLEREARESRERRGEPEGSDDISDRPDHPNRLDDDPDDFWRSIGAKRRRRDS